MSKIFILFLRRMREPLLTLIFAYSLSITGLVLAPGVDPQGEPWNMDFFHAVYFVSFMASTIGFGEIPYEFSDAQRMVTLVGIYLTVIAWLYAIGTILALLQDSTFRRAVSEWRFVGAVRRIGEPYYIVCGFGETGRQLVLELCRKGLRAVVVDPRIAAMQDLELESLPYEVPHLQGDAGYATHLLEAGLRNSNCKGVIALTNDDHANLQISIATKLLNKNAKVISVARDSDTMANMASFNTDHIVNPFYLFAEQLARALNVPSAHLVYRWLVQGPGNRVGEYRPPPHGTWIICGYGRFGKIVARYLDYVGLSTVIIEPDPEGSGAPAGTIRGLGTEAVTLREAGIQKAVGIVAGSDDDANNLSILMTARALRPDLYLVARENLLDNSLLFRAAQVDIIMQSSRMIVWHVMSIITSPLLDRFLRETRHQDEEWAVKLLAKLRALNHHLTPEIWTVEVTAEDAPALHATLKKGEKLLLDTIQRHPRDRAKNLRCIPLMLVRQGEGYMLPDVGMELALGDRLLYCGREGAYNLMSWCIYNLNVLAYLHTGIDRPESIVWRWLERRQKEA
jgi:Trk K+ transport system NAD-binding subunit